jgi:hypothetical protein
VISGEDILFFPGAFPPNAKKNKNLSSPNLPIKEAEKEIKRMNRQKDLAF